MKLVVGPELTFREGGQEGRSNATPIKKIFKILGNFDESGITPSYFLALTEL